MKLLFDHNLSARLVKRLSDLYPNATHVSLVGLSRESDETIWDYALINDYLIVTKDSDFDDLSVMRGFPPKVIWLRLGNCTTGQVEMLLRARYDLIRTFAARANSCHLEPFLAILAISHPRLSLSSNPFQNANSNSYTSSPKASATNKSPIIFFSLSAPSSGTRITSTANWASANARKPWRVLVS